MPFMRFMGPTFTLDVPTSWAVLSSAQFQVLFVSPPTRGGHQVNFSVMMNPRVDATLLSDYVEDILKSQATRYPEFSLLSHTDFESLHGVGGIRTLIRWLRADLGVVARQVQFFVMDETHIYILTGSRSEAIEADLAPQIDGLTEHMLASFSFEALTLESLFQ